MTDTKSEWARLVVSAMILVYFGWALVNHWTNGIEETLKSAFMILVGFWLGSSKGSDDKSKVIQSVTGVATGKPDDPINVAATDATTAQAGVG